MADGKVVDGFLLAPWMATKSQLQKLGLWRRAQKLMLTDLSSKIRARYTLQDVQQALKAYQSHMTGGKIIFVPEEEDAGFME